MTTLPESPQRADYSSYRVTNPFDPALSDCPTLASIALPGTPHIDFSPSRCSPSPFLIEAARLPEPSRIHSSLLEPTTRPASQRHAAPATPPAPTSHLSPTQLPSTQHGPTTRPWPGFAPVSIRHDQPAPLRAPLPGPARLPYANPVLSTPVRRSVPIRFFATRCIACHPERLISPTPPDPALHHLPRLRGPSRIYSARPALTTRPVPVSIVPGAITPALIDYPAHQGSHHFSPTTQAGTSPHRSNQSDYPTLGAPGHRIRLLERNLK
jgi:hypothetical protein